MARRRILKSLILLSATFTVTNSKATPQDVSWSTYNGQPNGDHYSPLKQIDRANVAKLKAAWIFNTGETGGLQTNPLIIGHTMYVYTPSQKVVALDAATGQKLWTFDAGVPAGQPNRGMTYWTDGKESRLFAGVMDHLYVLNPANGERITSFGSNGAIDLRQDLGEKDYRHTFAVMTTPGTLYKDLIITGFRAPETQPAAHGDIRAWDVHTGRLRWSFHTVPHPGEPGYDTWPKDAWTTTGSANNWAGMAIDQKRGIVYVPTGSAVPDFYGGDRLGNDLYADTLLALDADTGKLLWHFQGVHHDIWDRDFPSPPALVTVQRHGKPVDAVAQTTKEGSLFLLDRVNGKPLFPVEEHPFPPSDVPGEVASPTQPVPLAPAPFARQNLTADMLTQRTPAAHAWAEEQFKTFRGGGLYIPFSVDKQTIVFPGYDGGGEWGGPAVNPDTGILYINANDVAWTGGLTANVQGHSPGETTYINRCSACHGPDRKGSPPAFPSLIDIQRRLTDAQITATIQQGKGRMPSFPDLDADTIHQLIAYLHGEPADPSLRKEAIGPVDSPYGTAKYRFTGYRKFLDPDGYPAIVPPWGTLNAIDLNTGKYLWKIPFGNYPELARKGMDNTGSENYGGPVLTAGDLLFIGATIYDRKIRAFDDQTGKLLWQADLPYSGVATPATYMVNGRQYVVIATSGQRDANGPQGSAYVAFALP